MSDIEEQMMAVSYIPGPASGAIVEKDGEKWTLVIVRELNHPRERVWEALTNPKHLHEWAPFDVDGDLGRSGASVQLSVANAPRPMISETVVTRAERPRVLEYNWGEKNLRWELETLNDGTRLTLWHNIERGFIAWGAAGWQICFDVLDRFLSGSHIGRIAGPDALKYEWERLVDEYAKQFGVTAPKFPAK